MQEIVVSIDKVVDTLDKFDNKSYEIPPASYCRMAKDIGEGRTVIVVWRRDGKYHCFNIHANAMLAYHRAAGRKRVKVKIAG